MTRIVPKLTTDAQAEAFLEQDWLDLDFARFTPAAFEFQPKAAQLTLRMPQPLLDAVKERARAQGSPSTRSIRQVLERAVGQSGTSWGGAAWLS